MKLQDVRPLSELLIQQMERAIVGKRATMELIVTALLADGHVLLEDVPGVAKTATARALAEASGMYFSRVQFTPDLIPADITGAAVFTGGNVAGGVEFRPGPIFANLVLGDEINRAPPKTQSALLEAMEERQVTVDGETRPLPKPFMVIGTQNPIESEGTYPLPEAQMDRFLIRTGIGYPSMDDEVALILRRAERQAERLQLDEVLNAPSVAELQRLVETVHVSEPVARYVVQLVEATRASTRTIAGASPRGSLGLLKASRARAAMEGRSFVLPDDVKALAIPVLAHRLLLLPDQWVRGVKPEQVIAEVLQQVAAPAAQEQEPVQAEAAPLAAVPEQHPTTGYGAPSAPAVPLVAGQADSVPTPSWATPAAPDAPISVAQPLAARSPVAQSPVAPSPAAQPLSRPSAGSPASPPLPRT